MYNCLSNFFLKICLINIIAQYENSFHTQIPDSMPCHFVDININFIIYIFFFKPKIACRFKLGIRSRY